MPDLSEIAKFVPGDFRYGITLLSAFVLGILLLFLPELSQFTKTTVIPSLAIYTIGNALIGHIQILLTASANTKERASGGTPRGINESHLKKIIITYIIWLLLYMSYLAWRANA